MLCAPVIPIALPSVGYCSDIPYQSLYSSAMRQTHPSGSFGFSLIELMVTISIAALLMAIAAPSFRDLSIRNRLSTYTNDLISSINIARSEAVKRGVPVSICSSNDQETCSGTWSDGWIVFVNADGDSPATVGDEDDEPIIKIYSGLAENYALNADPAFADDITYRRDGSATTTGMLAFCHNDKAVGSRAIVVTPLRPRVARDTDDDRIPNRDDGANIDSCETPSGS
jgi:type IV fimbrial biogenesis protein FimT